MKCEQWFLSSKKEQIDDMHIQLECSCSAELCVQSKLSSKHQPFNSYTGEGKEDTFIFSQNSILNSEHFLAGYIKYLGKIGTYHIFITYIHLSTFYVWTVTS